jgi:glycine/sarcosine N-methyltransferase
MASDRVSLYDALSDDYDRFVNWEERLSNELPFIRSLLQANDAKRVLDSACGTGHHAIALTQQGYQAVGIDLSPGMVDQARKNAEAASVAVSFYVTCLGELSRTVPYRFDAILCLGNSLPHIVDKTDLRAALKDMAAVLQPGGILLLQNRNYDRVWGEKVRFMPLITHQEGDQEWLFFRFMDFGPETLTFNMVTFHKADEEWHYRIGSTQLRPLFRAYLENLLRELGFDRVEAYGDYQSSPFDPDESSDLIIVAHHI